MNRVILISNEKELLDKWSIAVDVRVEVIKLSTTEEIEDFYFESEDVVLLDMQNFRTSISSILKKSKVFSLAKNCDEFEAYKLLKSGLRGYDSIDISTSKLKDAIKNIQREKVWIYPELMSFIIQNSTMPEYKNRQLNLDDLTKKELEVAKLVAKGLTNNQIAEELDITQRTVKAHISSAFSKLSLKDRVSLAMYVKEFYS